MTYRVDHLKQLQNHELSAFHGARFQNLKNGQQAVSTYDEILHLCVFPQ